MSAEAVAKEVADDEIVINAPTLFRMTGVDTSLLGNVLEECLGKVLQKEEAPDKVVVTLMEKDFDEKGSIFFLYSDDDNEEEYDAEAATAFVLQRMNDYIASKPTGEEQAWIADFEAASIEKVADEDHLADYDSDDDDEDEDETPPALFKMSGVDTSVLGNALEDCIETVLEREGSVTIMEKDFEEKGTIFFLFNEDGVEEEEASAYVMKKMTEYLASKPTGEETPWIADFEAASIDKVEWDFTDDALEVDLSALGISEEEAYKMLLGKEADEKKEEA